MLPAQRLLVCLPLLAHPLSSFAANPPGWISSDFISAYSPDQGQVQLSLEAIAVNDTIDVLDLRDELIAGNRRLVDNSGDLKGLNAFVEVGLFDVLSLYYRHQKQDLTLKLGPIAALNVTEVSDALSTTRQEAGLKWTFYQANMTASNGEVTAAALELSWLKSESDDFDIHFDRISFNSGGTSASLNFSDSQRAGVDELEDDGWRARLIYSTQLTPDVVSSVWAGYSERSASSGTSSSLPIASLRDALTQRFDVDERHWLLGASLNWQITPRVPLQLAYEYLKIQDQDIVSTQGAAQGFALPSFLSGSALSREDANHTLSAALSWWATPDLNIGLTAKLFSHQFLGVIPHYNNPLSGSFAETTYGYLGLRLGLNLGK